MVKSLLLGILMMLATFAASAGSLKPDSASKSLCKASDYQHSFEGVWFRDNQDMLLFRLSYNENKDACYAWLNKQKAWGIGSVGSVIGKTRKAGKKIRFTSMRVIVVVDPAKKKATYKRKSKSRVTQGSVF